MDETTIVKFNPTVAELKTRVEESKKIVVTDLKDEEQMALVRASRKELRGYEIEIEKAGKEYRANALAYQKNVIAKERELKEITSSEIARLKGIEEESKTLILREERMKDLPNKRKKLEKIGDKVEITDEELLDMTHDEYMVYYGQRIDDKAEADERAKKEKELKAEREEEIKRAEEEGRKEGERLLKEKQEKDARREKEAAANLAKEEKYQAFLKEHGYNDKDFVTKDLGTKVVLYKKVAEFIK